MWKYSIRNWMRRSNTGLWYSNTEKDIESQPCRKCKGQHTSVIYWHASSQDTIVPWSCIDACQLFRKAAIILNSPPRLSLLTCCIWATSFVCMTHLLCAIHIKWCVLYSHHCLMYSRGSWLPIKQVNCVMYYSAERICENSTDYRKILVKVDFCYLSRNCVSSCLTWILIEPS